jgi:hypothetical protein
MTETAPIPMEKVEEIAKGGEIKRYRVILEGKVYVMATTVVEAEDEDGAVRTAIEDKENLDWEIECPFHLDGEPEILAVYEYGENER